MIEILFGSVATLDGAFDVLEAEAHESVEMQTEQCWIAREIDEMWDEHDAQETLNSLVDAQDYAHDVRMWGMDAVYYANVKLMWDVYAGYPVLGGK